jgi:hypothetical protein
MDHAKPPMTAIRLRHPDLVFHVDVTLTSRRPGLAVAFLADKPDIGTGIDPSEALRGALGTLGVPYVSHLG